jgi:hypothetical protein
LTYPGKEYASILSEEICIKSKEGEHFWLLIENKRRDTGYEVLYAAHKLERLG